MTDWFAGAAAREAFWEADSLRRERLFRRQYELARFFRTR